METVPQNSLKNLDKSVEGQPKKLKKKNKNKKPCEVRTTG